jgi:hypothetical protein
MASLRLLVRYNILHSVVMLVGIFQIWLKSNRSNGHYIGRAIAKAVSRWLPPRRPGFDPRSDHVGFVVDKVTLGQVFSEYFGFPCQSSIYQILHPHNHPGQVQ